MLVKKCPHCSALIPYGRCCCDKCAVTVEAERKARKAESDSRYNRKREKKYKAFYNSKEWKTLSQTRLAKETRCRMCGAPATEVDHIIDIKTPEGWAKCLDWSNTRSLCTKCHNKRHGRFQKRNPGGCKKSF